MGYELQTGVESHCRLEPFCSVHLHHPFCSVNVVVFLFQVLVLFLFLLFLDVFGTVGGFGNLSDCMVDAQERPSSILLFA